ncbi:MAG: hypothetical protein R3F11_07750 [Verrucomicrobiales bacterium]
MPITPLRRLALAASPRFGLCTAAAAADPDNADWREYLGGKTRDLYSPLLPDQPRERERIEVAWTYDTGEQARLRSATI